MTIPQEKRDALASWGLTPDQLATIELLNESGSKVADEKGLDRKETTKEEETETTTAEVETTVETPTPVAPPVGLTVGLTVAEVVEAMSVVIQPLVTRIDELEGKAKKKELDPLEGLTPSASIAAQVFKSITGQATDEDEADLFVDGRTSFAKQKPREFKEKGEGPTGLDFLNNIITGQPVGAE